MTLSEAKQRALHMATSVLRDELFEVKSGAGNPCYLCSTTAWVSDRVYDMGHDKSYAEQTLRDQFRRETMFYTRRFRPTGHYVIREYTIIELQALIKEEVCSLISDPKSHSVTCNWPTPVELYFKHLHHHSQAYLCAWFMIDLRGYGPCSDTTIPLHDRIMTLGSIFQRAVWPSIHGGKPLTTSTINSLASPKSKLAMKY
jgi:hypothetical protein